jgi:hypothetical protein
MYKFRFITSALLAHYNNISRSSANKTLNLLLSQKYIDRLYNDSYLLLGKSAQYYLAPKSLRLLSNGDEFNDGVVHAMYKNKSLSDGFIDRNVDILNVYLNFRDSYPHTFHMFTKSEIWGDGYFPDPKPSLYLRRIEASTDMPNEYLFDIFADPQLYVMKKQFDAYLEHYESGDWEAERKTDYPTILIACPDSHREVRLQAHIAKRLDDMGIDGLKVFTTTTEALFDPSRDKTIWRDVTSPSVVSRI